MCIIVLQLLLHWTQKVVRAWPHQPYRLRRACIVYILNMWIFVGMLHSQDIVSLVVHSNLCELHKFTYISSYTREKHNSITATVSGLLGAFTIKLSYLLKLRLPSS